MALGSVTTQLLFNPPLYEASGGDTLTASSGGTIVTPSIHTPISAEIGSFLFVGGLIGPGNITQGMYAIQSLSGGGYVLDRSCGSNGDVCAAWSIGGNLPFGNGSGSGIGLNVGGSHSATEGNNFSNVSDPGCIQMDAQPNATTGAPYIWENFTATINNNGLMWEVLGVPAGKFVVKMEGRCRAKVVTVAGTVTDVSLAIGVIFPPAIAPFGNFVQDTVTKDIGWATYDGPTFCISEAYSPSDTAVRLLISATGSVSNSSHVQLFVDTVEMTIYYDDGWCDYCTNIAISPTSVTLATGQSQAFTTNLNADFEIVEGGDSGSLSSVGAQSVLYTAGGTPGTYHLKATDSCRDPSDTTDATATITVVAAGEDAFLQVLFKGYNSGDSLETGDYGLPTNFLLQNPQENIVYQLEQNAVDVNNFIAGKTGFVELRRNGGATQDTTDNPVGFFFIELEYETT